MQNRIWLTDFLRGIAILMVVAFHLVFDLSFFYGWENVDYQNGFWFYVGRIAALMFMGMVGIVTAIIAQQKGWPGILKINLKRGLRLLGIGMMITLITVVIYPQAPIWFGILHLMGSTILLTMPLARLKWLNVIIGISILLLGQLINAQGTGSFATIPLGLKPVGFASLDYYPLIPWMGVILIGNGLGNLLYKKFAQVDPPKAWQKPLNFLGKHSLAIYLIHQPIFLLLLWMFI